jgi:hypothetical protein
MSDQRSIEVSIVRTLSASTNGQPPSHRRIPHRVAREGRMKIFLTVMVLGVVALCIAWRVYWHGSGDAKPLAEGPAESKVTIERDASSPRTLATRTGERRPDPSARPAPGHAHAGAAQPQAVPKESSASGDEPVTEAPSDNAATELPILQALDAPDDEARYRRLEEALGSGAEVPVDRMHEVLVTDPSDKVRELALQALTEQPEGTREEIRAVAEGALANPSPGVRTRAQRILDQMDALERMDRESRQFERAM